MTVNDFLAHVARADIPEEDVPRVMTALAALLAALAARQVRLPATKPHADEGADEPDRMLTAEEAAPMLGVAPRWLYRHAARLPFARRLSAKAVRFSEAGLRRWLASQKALGRSGSALLVAVLVPGAMQLVALLA